MNAPISEITRHAERAHDSETEFGKAANQAAVQSGAEAIKALLYLNGGACVVMLAFLSALASKDKSPAPFAIALICFASGAGITLIANAAAYFTNLGIAGSSNLKRRTYNPPFLEDTPDSRFNRKLAEICRWTAIALASASIVFFFSGLYCGFQAFSKL